MIATATFRSTAENNHHQQNNICLLEKTSLQGSYSSLTHSLRHKILLSIVVEINIKVLAVK
jgi:hypothetical protein